MIKKIILNLVIIISVIFFGDVMLGKILEYYYFKQESGLQYRTTYAVDKTTADVLVFGSSRANHHYHPAVFENKLKYSYYNVGRDGRDILYHAALLKSILKRYAPKIIIIDIDAGEFMKNEGSYDRLSALLPYYSKHPEMRAIIEQKSKYEKLKLLSSIYPYNSSLTTIIAGNSEFNKDRKGDIKGYVPLIKLWNQPIEEDNSINKYEIDSYKEKVFESFIQNCIQSKVKLYIVCSPFFVKYKYSDYSVIFAKEIAKRNSIHFIDYSNDSLFVNSPSYFADAGHLNDTGAKVFSNLLINKIINP